MSHFHSTYTLLLKTHCTTYIAHTYLSIRNTFLLWEYQTNRIDEIKKKPSTKWSIPIPGSVVQPSIFLSRPSKIPAQPHHCPLKRSQSSHLLLLPIRPARNLAWPLICPALAAIDSPLRLIGIRKVSARAAFTVSPCRESRASCAACASAQVAFASRILIYATGVYSYLLRSWS